MGKLSSKTLLSNPILEDRLHIIHKIAGVWTSFGITLETIKDFLSLYFFGFKKTTYVFTAADVWDYEPAKNEFVQAIFFKPTLATKIKIGSVSDDEYYQPETSEESIPMNRYCNESSQGDRTMNITLNGTGTVVILSILI
jgi:hypothetical protein